MDFSYIINKIISDINDSNHGWNEFIIGPMVRIGDWSEPLPDYAYINSSKDKTIAFVCAHPDMAMEYYLDKLELAVKVLSKHNFCVMVIPCVVEGRHICDELIKSLHDKKLDELPIAVIEYHDFEDAKNYELIRRLTPYSVTLTKRRDDSFKSFWCWWRDTSHFEVYDLLRLSKKYSDKEGDIYTRFVYPDFYNMMINGETKQWNGIPRTKKFSESTYKSEKQNYKIPMVQLGLISTNEGRLTLKGEKLLAVGDFYGADSKEYFDSLSKLILIDGKHLDLIRIVVEFQKENEDCLPSGSAEYLLLLDDYLTRNGYIGTRKPSAIKTGAKKTYVRDEPKLWNKLGYVKNKEGLSKYYTPFKGIIFNWDVINEVLLEDY